MSFLMSGFCYELFGKCFSGSVFQEVIFGMGFSGNDYSLKFLLKTSHNSERKWPFLRRRKPMIYRQIPLFKPNLVTKYREGDYRCIEFYGDPNQMIDNLRRGSCVVTHISP